MPTAPEKLPARPLTALEIAAFIVGAAYFLIFNYLIR